MDFRMPDRTVSIIHFASCRCNNMLKLKYHVINHETTRFINTIDH